MLYFSKTRGIRLLARLRRQDGPRHDKTNEMSVRLAETQISLGIRPI